MTDKERNQELLKLVAENPDLPIVAMVDWEVVGDDGGRWLGHFSRVELGELSGVRQVIAEIKAFEKKYLEANDAESN